HRHGFPWHRQELDHRSVRPLVSHARPSGEDDGGLGVRVQGHGVLHVHQAADRNDPPARMAQGSTEGWTARLRAGIRRWPLVTRSGTNNSETEGKREKLDLRAREMGGAILVPGGDSIGLGTPQSTQTIYSGFEERGYRLRIWPARYPNDEQIAKYQGRLAPSILRRIEDDSGLVSRPTDPDRFDETDLLEREAEYGRSGFSLQFMLDTTLSDENRYPLKLRDLIVTDVDPERAPARISWATSEPILIDNVGLTGDRFYLPMSASTDDGDMLPYEASVLFVDPSGRGKDETSYCVAKMLHGRVFIRRWSGFTGHGYDEEVLTKLARIAFDEQVNEVWTEDNFGDGMFNALFSPVLNSKFKEWGSTSGGPALDGYRVSGQKEARVIDKLEPPMNNHRVVMDKSIVENQFKDIPKDAGERSRYYNGFFQMAYLTRDRGSLKQDDRIDILAEAVGYFTEMVARDTESAADRTEQRARDDALADFIKVAKAGYRASNANPRPRRSAGSYIRRR
ncbi:MAG: phage terminase large subunit, partial [Planctomycetota bacterium]